jgi:hypothetical protein
MCAVWHTLRYTRGQAGTPDRRHVTRATRPTQHADIHIGRHGARRPRDVRVAGAWRRATVRSVPCHLVSTRWQPRKLLPYGEKFVEVDERIASPGDERIQPLGSAVIERP